MRPNSSPTGILILLIVGGIAALHFRDRIAVVFEADGAQLDESCVDAACGSTSTVQPDEVVLRAAEVCVDVGYLCADVESSGIYRILRWPDDTDRIRIRVPLPENEPPEIARALQTAAVRGFSQWDGSPFPLAIDTHRRSLRPADIVVTWETQLPARKLGETRSQWRLQGGRISYRVIRLALATRSPFDGTRRMDPEQVRLTAAHEMGHALGLPHSDRTRDVMYPTNTAQALTNRDYRTLEALYRMPNGAEIER